MHRLTVLIPCKDESLNIAACIASVRGLADEIIVADSGSTDGTLDVVRSLGGCRILEREYVNSADFKNWAIPQASHEWILIVDADERVTPELAVEIRTVLNGAPRHDAYRIRRRNFFLGHPIRYCGWDTPTVTRLLRKDVCRYHERRVHADVDVATGNIGSFRGRLEHYTAWDLKHFVDKQNRYSAWAAEDLHDRGKHHGLLVLLLRAPLRFFQLYILRGGFLDGVAGLIVCMTLAQYAFLKSAHLWSLQNTRNHPAGGPRKSRRSAAANSDAAANGASVPLAAESQAA